MDSDWLSIFPRTLFFIVIIIVAAHFKMKIARGFAT